MNMRDGATGKLVWESSAWGPDMFEVELVGPTSFLNPILPFCNKRLITVIALPLHQYNKYVTVSHNTFRRRY